MDHEWDVVWNYIMDRWEDIYWMERSGCMSIAFAGNHQSHQVTFVYGGASVHGAFIGRSVKVHLH